MNQLKDARRIEVLQYVGGVMGGLHLSTKELSRLTGIKYRTLMNRIGKDGDIGSMKLYELWAIQDVARRRGLK